MTTATLPHHSTTRHRYSIARVLSSLIADKPLDGLEAETSRELAKRYGNPRGVFIPTDFAGPDRRDLTTSTGAGATATRTDYEPLMDAVRARSSVVGMGAVLYESLDPSNLAMPTLTTAGSWEWLAEASAPTASGTAISPTTLTPRHIAGFVDVSRAARSASGGMIDDLIFRDMSRGLASALDRAALVGSGTNEPLGVLNTSGIGVVSNGTNGAVVTYAKLLELESTVALANGEDAAGSFGIVTSPAVRKSLRGQESFAGAGPAWTNANTLLGYPAAASTSVPSNLTKGTGTNLSALVYGDFSTLVLATWGALDLSIDPYRWSVSGAVRISIVTGADCRVRKPASWAVMKDIA